jgi:hypothetical protein
MAERRMVTPKIRFEVFKRDSFTCQYCGRTAPQVVLNVDHIKPVSKGGSNSILNLITSCFDCNSGKSNRELSDDAIITKQIDELKIMQAKREQLNLIMKWRDELKEMHADELLYANSTFEDTFSTTLTEYGKNMMSKLIKQFGFVEFLDALDIAATKKFRDGEALKYIAGICWNRQKGKENDASIRR